jgi:hypothetical protein
VGAGALGLGIGNFVYEELLGRPFGPSVGDLYFPFGQPLPLPAPKPSSFPFKGGQCELTYVVNGAGSYFNGFSGRREEAPFNDIFLKGSIRNPKVTQEGNIVRWLIDGTNRFTGERVTRELASVTNSLGTVSAGEFIRVDIRRENFSPDTCGDFVPEPIYEPEAVPRKTPPRPGELPKLPAPKPFPEPRRYPTPNPLPPTIPGPDVRPQPQDKLEPKLLPRPINRPFASPNPLPKPLPEPERERETPGRRPPTPTLECCPSLELKLDELLERPETEECDLSEVIDLLKDVLEALDGDGVGTIDLTPCVADEPLTTTYQGNGLSGVYSAIDAIVQSLNLIHTDTKCPTDECVTAVPDWWQVRLGANRPQLSIVLRKAGTKNYHTLNIPHPIVNPQPIVSPITTYVAGSWQGTLYLIDNSKFIVNAASPSVAQRVINEAITIINPAMLGDSIKVSITQRRGFPVNVDTMEPRYMQYFAEGQKSRRPNWRVNLLN